MKMHTVSDVVLQGDYSVDLLQGLLLEAGVNRHARLTYHGIVDTKQGDRLLACEAGNASMTLCIAGKPIFRGAVVRVDAKTVGVHTVLRVVCNGFSQSLDQTPHNRFFQNVNASYGEMIEQICNELGNASVIAVRGDRTIDTPILQYAETDWEFILRMAGRMETVVTPNLTAFHTQFALGFPKGQRWTLDENETEYLVQRSNLSYLKKTNSSVTSHYHDYLHYHLRSRQLMALGDKVTVKEKEYVVVHYTIALEQGAMIADYLLGTEGEFCVPFQYNERQAGLSLPGTVLSTSGQSAKLALDIDPNRDREQASDFFYAPQTNNGMYSMPQVGAKVMLQWQSVKDGDAKIIHSIHNAGGFAAYQERSLLTEFGKQMNMLTSLLSFSGGGNTLCLDDDSGVSVRTGRSIRLLSAGLLTIHAKKRVVIKTPEQLKMLMPGKTMSGIDVSGGQMHIKSSSVVVKGDPSKQKVAYTFPPRPKPIKISVKVLNAAMGLLPPSGEK